MKLYPSLPEEVAALTAISKAAFDTDVSVGMDSPGGPPDYDNPHWHEQMRQEHHLYTFADDSGTILGGAILFEGDEGVFIGRIFVDPAHHRQGLGIRLMEAVEALFPQAPAFRLDTPACNRRTNRFYRKLGYRETIGRDTVCRDTERDAESVYYIKERNEAP